jgi:hypothetical protein
MQTTLQELISELKSIESYDSIVQGIIKRAESKLKKEKEQIMDSYLQGSFDDGPNITNSEQYYNQTFNQNK